ncbi:hypothetical protein PN499_23755 [Kamptonema animale CS-326]|jgi:hypothetical protein|nr:hypothetical protein [Kamptonema animale]MDB9514219.1 hypothetical protein [Kamptonema animale CS-326]
MNNFNYLEKALELTCGILAIYQWCPSLGIAVAVAIILCLIDKCEDDWE